MLKIATTRVSHETEPYHGVVFIIEPLSKEEEQELLKKHTKQVKHRPGPGQRQQFREETDFLEFSVAKLDRQLVGWRGDVNEECTAAVKREIVLNPANAHIYEFLLQEIAEIGQAEAEREEEEEKN